ncbi:putative bifunctional diguanylate cyclase/phosphodiesterase [Actinoplanes sp. NPDC051343]|uniref:putative bifunctional diguanylate cyclase/phosphodiesterase n=1 Tax=Actinoplanes sp. NPDC051343 TaxID=3363906 RepID=UPI0037B5E614
MTLRRDPLLWALGLWSVLTVALLLSFHGDPRVLWTTQPPLDLACVWGSWQVQRAAVGPVRRFWRVLAAAMSLCLVGDTVQAIQLWTGASGVTAVAGPVQSAFTAVAQLAVTIVMLVHPAADQRGRVRLARWLDSATVLVGGGVVAWCFADGGAVTRAAAMVAAVTSFAAVKMVLSGNAPMHRLAALPMTAAVVVLCAGLAVPPTGWVLYTPVLASPLLVCGPRIQQALTRRARNPFGSRRRKPYSFAPYAAVSAVFAALVITLPAGASTRLWVAVLGAIAVVALVVARQLVSFQDNAALLDELRRQETRLRDQALYDGLTKLANRAHFHDSLAASLADGPAALVLVDLDHFKTVNDTMGHAAGDALLVEVAARLRTAVPEKKFVARLGGDEFAVLLPGATVLEADAVAERILAQLARPVALMHQDAVVVQCSIGVAFGSDMAELLTNADIAMYAAKDQGRATWVRYTPSLGHRIRRTAELAARLKEALNAEQFSLVYQPIVHLETGTSTGAETLLRWDAGPDVGTVPPSEFIPIAEESGLIVPIGRWVLRSALEQLASWRLAHPAAGSMRIGVNVAGRQLREPGFAAEVRQALLDTGLPGPSLIIEVTETALLDDAVAIETLYALRELGVTLALDDFGTAASSLGLILTCPMTGLKLDRSFVENVTTASRPRAVARAVSQIAATLNLSTVAEGIETAEQAEVLRSMGYRFGQGYLYSRPVPAADYAQRWLTGAPEPASLR